MPVVSRGAKAINERYRPMRFSELIGNEQNKIRLTKWMERGDKRSRAVLLSGVSSGGKTTTARILAMGLNCENGDTVEPCLECLSCKSAMESTAFHIIEHNMAEANTKEAAEAIAASMYETCITGRSKVYILDEVQKLTNSSQNLFLKAVEAPPKGVYIFFCTTEADALIPTLRNRFEHYTYTLPTDQDISALLADVVAQEKIELTKEQKIHFFQYVKGMSYREILFSLEQFCAGLSLKGMDGKLETRTAVNPFLLAKKVIYDGDFDVYMAAVNSGENLEFEAFRCMLRTMAGKEIEKNGFRNIQKAALYHDILNYIEERKFFDSNPRPNTSALVWRICADINDFKSSGNL